MYFLTDLKFFCYCWRRQSRGHHIKSTHELGLGNQRLLTPFPVLGMYSLLAFPMLVAVRGHGLERVMCCWNYLSGIYGRIPLRPLYNLLRFWQVDTESDLSCGDKPQDKHCKFSYIMMFKSAHLVQNSFSHLFFLVHLYQIVGSLKVLASESLAIL